MAQKASKFCDFQRSLFLEAARGYSKNNSERGGSIDMMLHPPIDKLMELKHIDSKYTLVVATAKRARQLQDAHLANKSEADKFVRTALEEIAQNKIKIVTQEE